MRKFQLSSASLPLITVFLALTMVPEAYGQQLKINDFVILGGSGGVRLASSTNIQGGTIGSTSSVTTNGKSSI